MTTLTPEQLDMLKGLQPLFKKKMGEWKSGDECIAPDGEVCQITNGDIKTWKLIPALSDSYDDCLRIPKPIDWQNPKRGCWTMLTIENRSDSVFLNE